MRSSVRSAMAGVIAAVVVTAAALPAIAARPASSGRVAHPDFNGDGYADLAIGVPRETVNGKKRAGAVNVIYGSASGLTADGNQLWHQDRPNILDQAETNDYFGWEIATGDFNRDGYTDLAIGARREAAPEFHSGGVNVIYGSAAGLRAAGNQFWTQDSPDILDQAERGDQFGSAMVGADFNDDGFDDLAIGVRSEDMACGAGGFCRNAGAVHIIFGSKAGLRAQGNQRWTQDSPGIPSRVESDELFGGALAAGDFDGDGFADLAVGAPYEDHLAHRAGLVHVIRGSAGGLTRTGTQIWSQGSPDIIDDPYLREQFGQSLAAGDLDGDGFADLVVGVWFQDFCTICNEGVVHAIYGSKAGLTAAGNQQWHQDSPGIKDTADVGDQFGQTLAIGDLDDDGFDDLAVGIPWEDFTVYVHEDQGAVNVIYGAVDGLTAAGNQLWHQDRPGILDTADRDDHLAEAIGIADFNGDGHDDLAISIPWESINGVQLGAVAVIYGTVDGLRAPGNQLWTQNSPGIRGAGGAGDTFGWSLSSRLPRSGSPRVCYGDRGGYC